MIISDLVTELSSDLSAGGATFHLDKQGDQWGWNEDPARGADTFHPFKRNPEKIYSKASRYTGANGQYYAFGSYTVTEDGDYLIDYGSINYGYSGRVQIAGTNYNVGSYSGIHTLNAGQKIIGYIYCGGGTDETGFLFIHRL